VRRIEDETTDVGTAEILATENRVLASRFGGSRGAYRAALARARASLSVARGILGDEIRKRELQARFRVARPSSATIQRYLATHATVAARRMVVSPAPSWLPEGWGYALGSSAPASVFTVSTGRSVQLRTIEGRFTVRALDETTALEVLPVQLVRSAVVRELAFEQRSEIYAEWTLRRQRGAESRLVCQKDRMPANGMVELSSFAPFLALHEAASTSDQQSPSDQQSTSG
jgi:hypothetical protein